MKHSIKTGFSFGITSAIITTLGLIVGLHSGTHSKLVILGGIIIMAVADSFSDALSIHISEESEAKHTAKEIWEATFSTFFSKITVTLTFIIPLLLLTLSAAIITSIIWGLFLLTILSVNIAKEQKIKAWKVVSEHLGIAVLVIALTHFIGDWISVLFA